MDILVKSRKVETRVINNIKCRDFINAILIILTFPKLTSKVQPQHIDRISKEKPNPKLYV